MVGDERVDAAERAERRLDERRRRARLAEVQLDVLELPGLRLQRPHRRGGATGVGSVRLGGVVPIPGLHEHAMPVIEQAPGDREADALPAADAGDDRDARAHATGSLAIPASTSTTSSRSALRTRSPSEATSSPGRTGTSVAARIGPSS